MKTKFKNLAALAALISAFSLSPSALADTGSSGFGITNATMGPTLSYTNGIQSTFADASIKNQEHCTIVFTSTARVTNEHNSTFVFAPVDSAGNVSTFPRITWSPTWAPAGDGNPTTNSIVVMTNLSRDVIGAATSLKLISVTVPLGVTHTTPALKVDLKTIR